MSDLKRIAREYKPRRVAFWCIESGEIISESGPGATLRPTAKLSAVLQTIAHMADDKRVRVLYIIGGTSAADTPRQAWWSEPAASDWHVGDYELKEHAATYTRAGVKIDVRMSAIWFGDERDPRRCREAYVTLRRLIAAHFDPYATLLATPSQTGADLFLRSLPCGRGANRKAIPHEYPHPPAELVEMLRHNAGQGRMEFCPDPKRAGQAIDGLYLMDARWMYAACVRHLPTGPVTHDTYLFGADAVEAYAPYKPGWYRVSVRVPKYWNHRGLIAVHDAAKGTTAWPCEPGEWIGLDGGVWTSGAELSVALDNHWSVLIHERWCWLENDLAGSDPAAKWISTLRRLRSDCMEHGGYGELMAGAVRNICIRAIGAWAMSSRRKLQITPIAQRASITGPVGKPRVDHRRGLIYWYKELPLSRDQEAMAHIEWAAAVWANSRRRLAVAALKVPRRSLVAYRNDALVTCDPLDWPDDGQPGTFRAKPGVPGPLAMPASADEMQHMRHAAAQRVTVEA